jgi:16S rRNA (cytidine1402-2'-O)-methyltransferase
LPPGETDIEAKLLRAFDTLSVKDAAQVVAAELGLPKRLVYAQAVALKARAKGE